MKSNILVVVDFSAWLYVTVFNAFNSWSKKYKAEFNSMVKSPEETDQENVPNLLVSESFKKELKNSTMKKLQTIDWILKRNCQDVVDLADEIVVVFAEDDFVSNNFRRNLFPEYKTNRHLNNQSWNFGKARDWVVNSILPDLNRKNEYIRIGVPNAEADDIIAVIMQDDSKKWLAKILISSDHDFCQIDGIRQFNMFGDEVVPWVDKKKDIRMTPEEVKIVKSLAGDTADNIPQVLPRMGVKTAWKLSKDREKLKKILVENKTAAMQYLLNRKLVDFDNIPQELQDSIRNAVHEKIDCVVENAEKTENEMFNLMEL